MIYRLRAILLIVTMFSLIGSAFSQMDWSNVKELVDYKKELKSLLKMAEKKKEDGYLMAKIGECYYMLNQMSQAQTYFEKAIGTNDLSGKYKLEYAQTLMAIGQYDAAKQWFASYAKEKPEIGNHYASQIDKLDILNKIAPIYGVKSAAGNSAQSEMAVSSVGSDVYFLQNHGAKGKSIKRILADGSVKTVNNGLDLSGVSYVNYSGNGKMVCYTKQATFAGQRLIPEAGLNDELFIAAVSPSGEWVNATKFTHNKSGFNCSYPALDFDGATLYFSSDRADGFGGQDIYTSVKDGAAWSFPVNVGSEVNTPGNEISPVPTGSSLYFSSNWNVGYGGYDVYRAVKSGNVYSKIYHQGADVNSSRDDYGFTLNEKTNTAYFVSNRASGKGLEDIYVASKPDENYVLNIKDATNKNGVDRAALDLSACGGTQTFTNQNGQFVFQLLSDSGCRIRIEKPGYEIAFVEVSKAKGREYTIMLESTYPTVLGQVLDQSTGQGLSDVKVAIENMASKEVQNLVTDNSGTFSAQLISGYTYRINYYKDGFQSNTKMINTGTRVSKDVIGSILLSKQSAPSMGAPIASAPSTSRPTTSTPSAPSSQVSKPSLPSSNNFGGEMRSGYAVQLAAIKPNKPVNTDKYQSAANSYGEVYIKEGSDYNRVRIGVFNTKAEAEQAKVSIRSAGFGSAYVVVEEGVTIKSGATEVYTSRSYTPAASGPEYVIRLAALSSMANVDQNLLNRYGKMETTQSNGLTIIYLSGFGSLSDANTVTDNLRSQGYQGAFVMKRENGTLQKIR